MRNAIIPFLLFPWDPTILADVIHTETQSQTHTHAQWISLVAGPALWRPSPLRPPGCPTADSDVWALPQSALRLLTDLHGLESALTQGNIEEWSVKMRDCSGQAQDLVAFICPPLISFFPLFILPYLH